MSLHPREKHDPVAGARNLLANCASAKRGQSLLILQEPAAFGIYEEGMVAAVALAAAEFGVDAKVRQVPFEPQVTRLAPELAGALAAADIALFFARLGDQLRFSRAFEGTRPIVSYALDSGMLGSAFGRADHRVFVALKTAIDRLLAGARDIHVTCPLGTNFRGAVAPQRRTRPMSAAVARFPMSVFSPLPAVDFAGRIALARFLVGSGSNYYRPYGVPIDGVVFADIEGGRVAALDGPAEQVERVRLHHEDVGKLLGIDPFAVHSWHAGIHPGCSYPTPALDNYERWSCGAFGNPRILHFHSCGDYAPGEISWNVIDATVAVDGIALWEDGRLRPDRFDEGAAILEGDPEIAALFEEPAAAIGV